MASTLSASATGLEIVDRARRHKGWNKTESAWQDFAKVSKSTLDRFWMQKPIKHENFVAICTVMGVDWEQIIDLPTIEPTNITRKSNLAQVNQPVILELEEFGQQIFDWFGALDFTAEGLPRRESKYVEWIIRVPARRRFDRVLIRATIHEVGLSDLDSLRRGVAQLRVDEGWLVTNLWVSQSVRQALNKSDDDRNLDCLTFDELIDRDADFTPYLDWLEREISKREIDRYYVDLGCTKGEFDPETRTLRGTSKYSVADGGIDRYIDRWLENPVTEHVSILGEFGTGKTWFAFHYAGKCLQAYREAKSKGMPRPRLPLVIPLRDYAKALDVENVFAGFFYTQHNIRLNSEVFDRLNQMGKLLLIFDGFDEMADKIDTQKMTDNFWELAKVVTTNAKVILTCRTEHFPTAQAGRENFGGERIPSTANKIAVAPKFETLELMKFDDEQIRAVLSRRTNLATVELVMANSQLLDLLRRAVMAEFVLEALPEIEAGKPIDLARVYLYAVRHKMERDITTGRTFTSLADKLYFLCELAWEMLSEDKMSINYREFPDRLRVLFKNEVKEQKHLDHWHYDMMGQTMLIRNDDGDYSPAHRSLLEFFVAYKLAAELGLFAADFLEVMQKQSGIDESLEPQLYTWSDYWRRKVDDKGERELIAPLAGFKSESPEQLRGTFGKSPLTKAILELLLPALNIEVKYRGSNQLLDLIKSTKAADVGYLGGNAATVVGYLGGNAATVLVNLEANALEYQNLSGTNLTYANLVNAGLRGTDLSGANLENCLTTSVFRTLNTLVISKDDSQFITAHDDGSIRIWDRASGRELQNLIGHQDSVNCLALSGDGQFLYSGSTDSTIKEWDLTTGSCRRTFTGYHIYSVNTIALSGDGKYLYFDSRGETIQEWDLKMGSCRRTFEGHQDYLRAIILSKDGRSLYSGSDDCTIKEWDLTMGTCHRTFTGHQDSIDCLALSGDGRSLYSGGTDSRIKEWDLTTGSCRRTSEGYRGWSGGIDLSADGQFLYYSSRDSTIKELNLLAGNDQRTFEGHQDGLKTIVLSADRQLLYSGGSNGTIKEWNISDGTCQRTLAGHKDWLGGIDLSADGQLLYSGGNDGIIREWNLSDGTCQRIFAGHKGWVGKFKISIDGQFLYSSGSDGNIKEWNLSDGTCQRTIVGNQFHLNDIAINANEKSIYSVCENSTIKEWNLANGICDRTFKSDQIWIVAIVLSCDGQWLYAGGHDGNIKEWNLIDGIDRRTFHYGKGRVITMALSIDGQYLYSGGIDGTISEWKLANGNQRIFECHQRSVNTIALSKNGQFIYSGSDDRTIKGWDIATGECLRTFKGHLDEVRVIALSADCKLLYSGGNDGSIKVWDVSTGECLRSIDYRLCAGANITNVKGLTPAQTDSLIALGAFSDD
jgi:WD40 repeat protein